MTHKVIEAMARAIMAAGKQQVVVTWSRGEANTANPHYTSLVDEDDARRMALAAIRALLTQEGLSRHMLAAFKAQACCEYAEWHISDEGEPMPPLATIDGDFNLNLVSAAMLTALVEEAKRDA